MTAFVRLEEANVSFCNVTKDTSPSNKRRGIYILACHIRNGDDTSRIEWSLYHDNDVYEDEEPLVELNNTTDEDFHNIVDGEDWESEDIGLIIVK